jgi:hypothetical protein
MCRVIRIFDIHAEIKGRGILTCKLILIERYLIVLKFGFIAALNNQPSLLIR